MATLVHPQIGTVTGLKQEKCNQFLGIKYANLRDKLAVSELVTYDGSGLDATKYGPPAVDMEQALIQQTLPKPSDPGTSELEGLNLNVTVPSTGLDPKNLPVLVFIHGGGLAFGGNWWPQYDLARLVKLSIDVGKPFVGVNINYRVGLPGFLTSAGLRERGYKPNNGLRDQRTALKWVKKYIGGFGGDSNKVTVMGESAGGVSTGYLLLSEESLARRLILLGGSPPLLGQLPLKVADHKSEDIARFLGLKDVTSPENVQRLVDMPAQDFLAKIPPSVAMIPVIDGDIIPLPFGFETLSKEADKIPGYKTVDAIMAGVSTLDASIMSIVFGDRPEIASAFRKSVANTLKAHPNALEALLVHYNLAESATASQSNEESLLNILHFINDVAFIAPANALASAFPKDAYRFAFNEPNPWNGPYKGHASHILDVAFLFQNYNDKLNDVQRRAAETFGKDAINFVNGEAPWKAFNKGQNAVAVYEKGVRTYAELSDNKNAGRSTFLTALAKEENGPSQSLMMEVFTNFMSGQ